MVTIFVLGVVVALLVEEATGIRPGGIIVPGFLALYVSEPLRIVATLLCSLAVFAFILGLRRYVFLYGQRRFGYAVATGVAFKSLLAYVFPKLNLLPFGLLIIGLVIPGLIAENFLRQGVWKTLASMTVATAITRLGAFAIGGWLP